MQQLKQQVKMSEQKQHVARRDKLISLYPLDFDDAVAGILRVPPEPKEKHPTGEKQRSRKKT